MIDREDPAVLFAHIGRTGGAALIGAALAYEYPAPSAFHAGRDFSHLLQELRRIPEKELLRIRMISGHAVYFGAHQCLPQGGVYISVMREPIDRIVSTYYAQLDATVASHHEIAIGQDIVEFQKSIANWQLCWFIGREFLGGSIDESHLNAAKENIEHHFPVVGISTMLPETLFLMERHFSWREHYYCTRGHHHVGAGRPSVTDLPSEIVEQIRADNALDCELYEYVKQRLLNQIDQLSADEQRMLESYRHKAKLFEEVFKSARPIVTYSFVRYVINNPSASITVITSCEGVTEPFHSLIDLINKTLPGNITLNVLKVIQLSSNSEDYTESLAKVSAADRVVVVYRDPGDEYFAEYIIRGLGISLDNSFFMQVEFPRFCGQLISSSIPLEFSRCGVVQK